MANIKSLNKVRESQHKLITKQLKAKVTGRETVAQRHVSDMVKRGALESRMHELRISLKCDFSDMKHYMAHPNAAYGSLTAGRLAHRIGKTQATIEAYIYAAANLPIQYVDKFDVLPLKRADRWVEIVDRHFDRLLGREYVVGYYRWAGR